MVLNFRWETSTRFSKPRKRGWATRKRCRDNSFRYSSLKNRRSSCAPFFATDAPKQMRKEMTFEFFTQGKRVPQKGEKKRKSTTQERGKFDVARKQQNNNKKQATRRGCAALFNTGENKIDYRDQKKGGQRKEKGMKSKCDVLNKWLLTCHSQPNSAPKFSVEYSLQLPKVYRCICVVVDC